MSKTTGETSTGSSSIGPSLSEEQLTTEKEINKDKKIDLMFFTIMCVVRLVKKIPSYRNDTRVLLFLGIQFYCLMNLSVDFLPL